MSETLDLTKVFDRDIVTMPDGKDFEIRNPEEFSVLEEHRLNKLLQRISDAQGTSTDSEEAAQAASEMLHELATLLIVDLTAEVEDWACVAIFRFWLDRLAKQRADNPVDPPTPSTPRRRTSASSSRGSKRSTAATRKRGSASPRTS